MHQNMYKCFIQESFILHSVNIPTLHPFEHPTMDFLMRTSLFACLADSKDN
jgi:hypothetical protein